MTCDLGGFAVARLAGAAYDSFYRWGSRGLVAYDRAPNGDRRYTLRGAIQAAVIVKLRAAHVQGAALENCLTLLNSWLDEQGQNAGALAIIDGRPFWVGSGDTLVDLLSGQLAMKRVFLVNVAAIATDVRAQFEAACRAN